MKIPPRLWPLLAPLKLWEVPAAASGLPMRSRTEERVGAVLAGAAVAWIFLVAVWGINGLFPDGHFASTANIGTIGYNMNRYGTIYAYYPFFDRQPAPSASYMHHPLGVFWMAGLLIKLFGDHNWVLRLPAVIYVTLTAFFMYRCGRAIWGPLEGAVAAIGYTALPITIGFANYHDMEQPVMMGCLVATWGYARFRQSGREAYALASAAGFAFAIVHDWEAYVWGLAFLLFLFARAFVLPPGLFGRFDARKLGRYWAIMAGTAVMILALTVKFVLSADRLADLVGVFGVRTAGNSAPLSLVLQSRHIRIELMFSALAIALGKLAVPVILGRFVVRRNELEILPIFLLWMAVVYYVLFKQGADVHIFWPHPFATYFGLAIGALLATVRDLYRWAEPRLRGRFPFGIPPRDAAPWLALAFVGLPLVLVFRDGASLVRLSRESGGRFMEVHAESEIDKNTALRWFLQRFPSPTEKLAFHGGFQAIWHSQWEMRPRVVYRSQPLVTGTPPFSRFYAMDARYASSAELKDAARRYQVHAVGYFWFMDRGAPAGPLQGYSFETHDPGLLESLSQGATEPIRRVVPDPWVTWEWRTLLGQAAKVPQTEPATGDQIRIAHNAAVDSGDKAAATQRRQQLQKLFDIPISGRWSNGIELLGTIHHRGAARSLTPYLLITRPATCVKVIMRAHVTRRRFLSTLPVDPADPDIAYPPPYPCDLWRAGHIYAVPVVYRHRAGHEEFSLTLGGWGNVPAPARLDGPATIKLLEL